MANILLDNLVKTFGKQTAVKNLCLDIKDGEFVAILGPSGCGKTTTMNMISGLLQPDSGKIYFDGKEMNNVPVGKRGVGFVFQNYAIFTYMTAFDNIAFGLKIKKLSDGEINKRVNEVAALLQIEKALHIKASRLSINDMQKVALARSMVTEPKIFLLDEPLSNLDATLRNVMRAELKNIQQELRQTAIYVTHDQIEAMSLADRIAVMNFAVLQQFDTPLEVYNRPKNLFVAGFIGSPTINLLDAVYDSGDFILADFQNKKQVVSEKNRARIHDLLKQEKVVLGIRPEHLKLCDSVDGNGNELTARVVSIEPLGSKTVVYLKSDSDTGNVIKAIMGSDYRPKVDQVKTLNFREKDLYLFDKISTELVFRF
jgi:multiple sugar transport system ATP-binding protein